MTDNKVVIKINVDRKSHPLKAAPQTITVWHTRRILIAALAFVLLAIILFSWLSDDAKNGNTQINSAEKVQPADNSSVAEIVVPPVAPAPELPVPAVSNKAPSQTQAVKKPDAVNKPAAIILSRKVIRASLNANLKDSEPGEPIKLPVNIGRNQSIELFYFTEVRNMNGKVLFHQWLRNGQIVHQKQLDIKSQKSKDWSGKTLSAKDKGEWQVRLSDKKTRVYSEANFWVNAE